MRLRELQQRCAAALEHYSTIFDLCPSACLTLDSNGVILEANRAMAQLLGTTTSALAGQKFEDQVLPEDRARYRIHLRADSLHGSQICSDFHLVRRDGSTVPVMMESVKIDHQGRCSLLLTDLQDITARRRIEKALQDERDFNATVLATSGALIIVLDEAGRILRFNQACERTSGYTAAEAIGNPFWDLLLPKEQVERVRGVFDAIGTSHLPSRYENHWVTKSGELRLISWANSVLKTEDGGIRAIVGSGLDITERRRLEAEVLEIAEREQRRIGTDLHDGLGQQLTAMSLMCENLREDLAPYPEFRGQAAALGACLREAIGHTRDLSHGLMLRNLEVAGLRDALESLAATTAAASSIPCDFECDMDAQIFDIQIAGHLYHIAQEALNNALKHGAPTRIQMKLSLRDGAIHLWIHDNGKGFESTLSTGIGLAAMEYRSNLMGGALNITSSPGAGVTIDCVVFLKQ
jgi:PAS domain S-box-containing protein